jgi:hypothetical protein
LTIDFAAKQVRSVLAAGVAILALWYVFGGPWERDVQRQEAASAKQWCRENAIECIKAACEEEFEAFDCRTIAARISDSNQRRRESAEKLINSLTTKSP